MSIDEWWKWLRRWHDVKAAARTGRLTVGSNLRIECRFFLSGPGRLEIGNNVTLRPSFWDRSHYVTFATHAEEAVISIGDNTVLEGTRFGCVKNITIGSASYLSECTIMDTDFHSWDQTRRDDVELVNAKPVVLEPGVKVGFNCHVLRGVTIGRGTTVRPHSIVLDSLPPDIVAFGYPARPEPGD